MSTSATRSAPLAPARALETTGVGLWTAPIHTAQADPEGGAYGIWASGPDYKVSFHDGYVFYPVLGSAYPHNLPLRWNTTSIRLGNQELIGAKSQTRFSDWRFEWIRGSIIEAYDVREDGVYQTFTLNTRPAGTGDLVVQASIRTELHADPVVGQHTALVFRDSQGTEILRYDSATAVDAAGNSVPVLTSYDGDTLQLEVPGAWLQTAAFPVTIDPLTSSTIIATWGSGTGGQPSYPDVARNDEDNDLYHSYSRSVSASDYDTFGRVTADDLSGTTLVFTDVTSTWSTRFNQVCYVPGADKWAACLGRNFPTTNSDGVRVYLHDRNNTTLNSGNVIFLPRPAGTQDQTPSIGGGDSFSSSDNALLAWRRDTVSGTGQNTNNSEVHAVLVDCMAGTFGTQFQVDNLGNGDAEVPCVTKVAVGSGSFEWVIAWEEYNNGIANDDWDARIALVDQTGSVVSRNFVGPSGSATHKTRVKVEGQDGRYLASWKEETNNGRSRNPFGSRIAVERFDWVPGSSVDKKGHVTIALSRSNSLTTGTGNRGIAYDTRTDSHWAVAWHSRTFNVFATRVGYQGQPLESVTVYNTADDGFSPSMVFNNDSNEMTIIWATNENAPTGQPVLGAQFQYPMVGSTVLSPASCSSATIGWSGTNAQQIGHEFSRLRVNGAPTGALHLAIVSFAPVNVPVVNPAVAPGCRLYVASSGPAFLGILPLKIGSSVSWQISLPEFIAPGPVFFQDWHTNSSATRFFSTQGLRVPLIK